MFEIDRITIEPCGCWVDKVTGVVTHFCGQHEIRLRKSPRDPRSPSPGDTPWKDLTVEVKIALAQAMIPYMAEDNLDAFYHQYSYLVEMPGSPVRRKVIV